MYTDIVCIFLIIRYIAKFYTADSSSYSSVSMKILKESYIIKKFLFHQFLPTRTSMLHFKKFGIFSNVFMYLNRQLAKLLMYLLHVSCLLQIRLFCCFFLVTQYICLFQKLNFFKFTEFSCEL